MADHSARELTGAVVAALEAADLNVGRGIKPDSVPDGEGWVIVYPLTGGSFDGATDDPWGETLAPYQLQSVGATPEQCEWIADLARSTLMGASLSLTGRKVIQIAAAFSGGVLRDDDVQPPVYYTPDRFDIWTGPSP